jgi:hypothetical protein
MLLSSGRWVSFSHQAGLFQPVGDYISCHTDGTRPDQAPRTRTAHGCPTDLRRPESWPEGCHLGVETVEFPIVRVCLCPERTVSGTEPNYGTGKGEMYAYTRTASTRSMAAVRTAMQAKASSHPESCLRVGLRSSATCTGR